MNLAQRNDMKPCLRRMTIQHEQQKMQWHKKHQKKRCAACIEKTYA